MPIPPRPVMLVILDGFGWREETADNAVRQARTPNFTRLWATCPHAFLRTSGLDVGLPDGQMGNSEVGHMNIGAGRVVMQDLPRIGQAVADGSIARAPALLELIAALQAQRRHLPPDGAGLAGRRAFAPGPRRRAGRHRWPAAGIPVAVHAFTDGRDTPPSSGARISAVSVAALPEGARIATVSGRYYAMDRDKRWDRVARAYAAAGRGRGPPFRRRRRGDRRRLCRRK